MFNSKQFEEKVYALVTKEVNEAFNLLLKGHQDTVQIQGIKLQREMMKVLHGVVSEVAAQILYGLLAYTGAKK